MKPEERSGSGSRQGPPLPPVQPPRNELMKIPEPPAPVQPSDHVSLSAEFHPAGDKLAVGYRVENHGSREIWVPDVQVATSPPSVTPLIPRILFETPATVVVACWYSIPHCPPGTAWYTPPVFYATRVAVGEQYRSALQLPLPLDGTDVSGTRAGHMAACRYARFEVAVIPASPGVSPVTVSGRQLGCFFSGTLESRRLLASRPVPVRIPVVSGRQSP